MVGPQSDAGIKVSQSILDGSTLDSALELADSSTELADSCSDCMVVGQELILNMFDIYLPIQSADGNKGDSRPRHLQGKGEYTGLVRQAWGFPLFDPM